MTGLRQRWRVAKWLGSGVLAFNSLAWLLSLLLSMDYLYGHGHFGMYRGLLLFSYSPSPRDWPLPGLHVKLQPVRPRWSAAHRSVIEPETPGAWELPAEWSPVSLACIRDEARGDLPSVWFFCPLWIPFVLMAIPTGYLFWRDRRRPSHCCQSCGYDLTANVSGTCPECGEQTGGSRATGDSG